MKKNIIIYFLLNTLFVMAQAPAIAWQKRCGGSLEEVPTAMQKTADGGFIIVGYSDSNISCDKTENNFAELDYWVTKLDSNGVLQWQRTLGGGYALIPEPNPILIGTEIPYAIVQANDGGYLVGGFSRSQPSGNKTSLYYGETDVWVVKLDNNGNILWQNSFGGNYYESVVNIINTADNGFVLCCTSTSNISGNKTEISRGGTDIWLIKIDSNGNEQWQKAIGGSAGDAAKIATTPDGGYILGGGSGSPISGEKTIVNFGSGSNIWLVKLDSLFNIVWQKVYGGTVYSDNLTDILVLPDGGYLLGATSNSGISGNKTVASHAGSSDFWIIRTDSSGNDIWQKSIGGTDNDFLQSLGQYSDGSFLLDGTSLSQISGDKTSPKIGNSDAWLVKINASGTILWDKTIGGQYQNNLSNNQILSDDSVVLAGKVASPVYADVTLAGCNNSVDFWIVKLQAENLSISQNSIVSTKIYPNPIENFINIDFQNTKENINISFINSLGQIIKNKKFYNTLNIRLNTEDFSSGIYFLKIETDDNQSEIFKIIKH